MRKGTLPSHEIKIRARDADQKRSQHKWKPERAQSLRQDEVGSRKSNRRSDDRSRHSRERVVAHRLPSEISGIQELAAKSFSRRIVDTESSRIKMPRNQRVESL